MTNLEINITDHNKVAELLEKVLPKYYKEIEQFKNKKIFKADGSLIKKLHDNVVEIRKELSKNEVSYVRNSYGNIDIYVKGGYYITENNYHYFEGSIRLGKTNNLNELDELIDLEELLKSETLQSENIENRKDSYKETKEYFKEVAEKWETLSWEDKDQLRQDFWFLR